MSSRIFLLLPISPGRALIGVLHFFEKAVVFIVLAFIDLAGSMVDILLAVANFPFWSMLNLPKFYVGLIAEP